MLFELSFLTRSIFDFTIEYYESTTSFKYRFTYLIVMVLDGVSFLVLLLFHRANFKVPNQR